jgi:hypothetical protein
VDIAILAAPTKVGFFPVYASDVAIAGRYAYLASDTFRIVVLTGPVAARLTSGTPVGSTSIDTQGLPTQQVYLPHSLSSPPLSSKIQRVPRICGIMR